MFFYLKISKQIEMKFLTKYFSFITIILLFGACGDKDKPADTSLQKIKIHFDYKVEGQSLVFDSLMYVNAAGNHYLVNEIQYFISDVILHRDDGSFYQIGEWTDMHYVDSDIPSTQTWEVFDNIPAGTYSGISFTLGINSSKNQSYMFPDPPERDMFWPDYLGGGYHYMKLNGKWLDTLDRMSPFDFHLGIGQIYAHYPDSIISFVDNSFQVVLPNSGFIISENETKEMSLSMNVENWFSDPNTWDFNYWGGSIMQNQDAMHSACLNGWDVFSILIQ